MTIIQLQSMFKKVENWFIKVLPKTNRSAETTKKPHFSASYTLKPNRLLLQGYSHVYWGSKSSYVVLFSIFTIYFVCLFLLRLIIYLATRKKSSLLLLFGNIFLAERMPCQGAGKQVRNRRTRSIYFNLKRFITKICF